MKDFQPLNFEHHKNLNYTEKYGDEHGHQVGAVMILPNEFAEVQREYPILFRKDPETGGFFPVALLGLEEHENLFLENNSNWNARYIPLSVRKGPFLVGFQQQESEKKLVVYIDINDTRVQKDKVPLLFNGDGTGNKVLNDIRNVLAALHEGAEQLVPMVESFLKYDLLEQVIIEIDLLNGSVIKFDAGYTVNIDKLFALKSDAILELHNTGYLSLAYNVAHSVNNMQRLIDIKNSRMK